MRDERAHMWKLAGRYSALGIELVVCVVLGTLGGQYIDHRFDCSPWGLAIGMFVGIGAAIVSAKRIIGGPVRSDSQGESLPKEG